MDRLYVIGQIRRVLDGMDDRQLSVAYRWLMQQADKRTTGGSHDGRR